MLIIFASPAARSAPFLTESAAVELALARNPEIRIAGIESRIDSLNLEEARAAWLPQIDFEAGQDWVPRDTLHIHGVPRQALWDSCGPQTAPGARSPVPCYESRLGLVASQALPTGGKFSLEGFQAFRGYRHLDTADHSVGYGLTFSQPLLRNAGAFGSPALSVRLRTLENGILDLQRNATLAHELSSVRALYWQSLRHQSHLRVARQEHARSLRRLAADSAATVVGRKSSLDSISAAIQAVKAERRAAEIALESTLTHQTLSLRLGLPADSLLLPDSLFIGAWDPGTPGELFAKASAYDPGFHVLARLREKLALLRSQARNAQLPALDFRVSYGRSQAGPDPYSERSWKENLAVSLAASYAFPDPQAKYAVLRGGDELRSASARSEQMRDSLRRETENFVSTWKRQKADREALAEERELARKQLMAAEKGYEVGSTNLLVLLDARDEFVRASDDYVDAAIGLKLLEVAIDEMTGAVFPKFGIETR
jgi:outer membrane protein TolC